MASNDFFGEYLLQEGIITQKALEDAVAYQKMVDIPIDLLAVDNGRLTPEQADTINTTCKNDSEPFELVAQRLNLLTERDIEALNREIASKRISLKEALFRSTGVDKQVLDESEEYFNQMALAEAYEVDCKLPNRVVDEDIWHAFLESTGQQMLKEARIIINPTQTLERFHSTESTHLFTQEIDCHSGFAFILEIPQETLNKITEAVESSQPEEAGLPPLSLMQNLQMKTGQHACQKLAQRGLNAEAAPSVEMPAEIFDKLIAEQYCYEIFSLYGSFTLGFGRFSMMQS